MKLYHYTKKSYFEKIWESKTLKFSSSRRTNDLFEKRKLVSVPNCPPNFLDESGKSFFIKHFYEILFSYNQISLTMDYSETEKGYTSPMMWGHYGNYTKGVCIELDCSKLDLNSESIWMDKVDYCRMVPFIDLMGMKFDNDSDIHYYIEANKTNLFFKKHFHWEHENEFRIISNSLDYLSIENAMTAVYVAETKGHTFQAVKRLVKGDIPIRSVIESPLYGYTHLTSYKVNNG